MRVSVGGKRTEFTTQREWDPTKWNSLAGRPNGTKEAAKELNAFLGQLIAYARINGITPSMEREKLNAHAAKFSLANYEKFVIY